ncbi:hypothetical protein GLOTRDRAFT_122764, partial [Gloeophyllum trabeum ATCC 11539]
MPVAEKRNEADGGIEHDREKDRSQDRDRERAGKGPKPGGKAKDLSHVPCKFFKVGSCTAGSSCPFSHSLAEPGQPKDVCAWFVKGNCKFGHKCALAHILPGQPMAMDRKNKKAAQLAANAGGGGGGQGKDKGRGHKNNHSVNGAGGGNATVRNSLLGGSTAPTRVLSSSRPPMSVPLKATISPSAPAPPIKDTDFASFAIPDESKLPSAPAQRKTTSEGTVEPAPEASQATNSESTAEKESTTPTTKKVPSPLPVSNPAAPRNRSAASPSDLGPIGSPPKSSSAAQASNRIDGFSPGTSPSKGEFVPSSPFSAPHTQSIFVTSYEKTEIHSHANFRSGLAASLGATRTWGLGPGQDMGARGMATEVVVEDDDLEELIPSSLTDLLTPEERSRRFSRTNSGQNGAVPAGVAAFREGSAPRSSELHHRHSRSVPAASLLNDLKSIWSENGAGGPALGVSPGLGNGSPSSFASNGGFGGRAYAEDTLSPSLISPTNASAAFLPGLHHHYKNARSTGVGRMDPPSSRIGPSSSYSNNFPPGPGAGMPPTVAEAGGFTGAALSPPRFGAYGGRPPFESVPTDPYLGGRTVAGQAAGRPIPVHTEGLGPNGDAFSPSARALQAHAPGQSLPQGLAAGYSRIHARPPPSIPSPAGSAAFSPPQISNLSSSITGRGLGDHMPLGTTPPPGATAMDVLDSMMSRLSYTAAAGRTTPTQQSTAPSAVPPVGM